jgi:Pentapeptide repeats (8 copies)
MTANSIDFRKKIVGRNEVGNNVFPGVSAKRLLYLFILFFVPSGLYFVQDGIFASNPIPVPFHINEVKPIPNPDDLKRLLETNSCVGCDLRGANLQYKDLYGADLRNSLLGEANLDNANLEKADFRGSKLFNDYELIEPYSSREWYKKHSSYRPDFGVVYYIYPSDFKKVLISESSPEPNEVNRQKFTIPFGATFRKANLIEANFSDVLLRGVIFREANLTRSDFRKAQFGRSLDFQFVNLKDSKMKGAVLSTEINIVFYEVNNRERICPYEIVFSQKGNFLVCTE